MEPKVETWAALKYQIKAWQAFGIVRPPKDPMKRRLYIFHASFVNIVALLGLMTTFVLRVITADSIGDALEYLYPTITCASTVFKVANCLMLRNHLISIRPIFKELDKRIDTPKEVCVIMKAVRSVHFFFKLFMRMVIGIIIAGTLQVILSKERTLFFPAWYPWNWKTSRKLFLLTLAHQLYAITFVGLQETANAAYPQAYLEMLMAHVKALRFRVLNLATAQHDTEAINEIDTKKRIYQELAACIKDHMTILQLYSNIQYVLSLHCLIQLIATGLVQCAIAVSVLYTDISEFSKIGQMFIFLGAITVEMFVLCYSGEMFCQECEKLSHAIYDCNWVGQSLSFQRGISFFLHRSQQFSVIMAGNFMPVNYPTFLQLVKTSYSMFTLLNNVRQR